MIKIIKENDKVAEKGGGNLQHRHMRPMTGIPTRMAHASL